MPAINGVATRVTATCLVLLMLYVFWHVVIDGTLIGKPVEYWPGCFTSIRTSYTPGDSIRLMISASKYKSLRGEVTWNLMNLETHELFKFAARETTLGTGTHTYNIPVAVVPARATPGKYQMIGMVTYQVNPLKVVTYQLQSDNFTVREGGDDYP